MDIFSAGMESFFAQRLARREEELRDILRAADQQRHEANEADLREVVDFKDVAAEQSLAMVDEANAEHAFHALKAVVAARRRLAGRTYGKCADCGEAIDVGRLIALPATLFCTACQARRELGHTTRLA